MRASRLFGALILAMVGTSAWALQATPGVTLAGEVKARGDAFFAALASGSPDRFEAMAQEQFAPELLARRTPAERKSLLDRLKGDFGELSLVGMERQNDVLVLRVRGATGLEGRIELGLEAAAPYRITRLGVEVGGPRGGESGEAALPSPPISGAMAPGELEKALDGYIAPLAATGAFSGVVLVARDGAAVYRRAYGLANRERPANNSLTTRFSLGSINKAFTKVAIGQLVAQGKLSLTDTIGKLLPDYPNADAHVATVEQLLDHQAGIADFFGPAFAEAPKDRFSSNAAYYAFVAPQPLLFTPGTRRQYCNGCYIVLGAIVERVAGVRYEDYVVEHVFKPAGMSGAGFFRADAPPADVAVGYTKRAPGAEGALTSNAAMHGVAGSAAGGAYATVADLLAFDSALREKRLLDAKGTAWVLEGREAGAARSTASLGIAGGAPGVNASLESDGTWTVIVLANLDPQAAERLGQAIFRQLATEAAPVRPR